MYLPSDRISLNEFKALRAELAEQARTRLQALGSMTVVFETEAHEAISVWPPAAWEVLLSQNPPFSASWPIHMQRSLAAMVSCLGDRPLYALERLATEIGADLTRPPHFATVADYMTKLAMKGINHFARHFKTDPMNCMQWHIIWGRTTTPAETLPKRSADPFIPLEQIKLLSDHAKVDMTMAEWVACCKGALATLRMREPRAMTLREFIADPRLYPAAGASGLHVKVDGKRFRVSKPGVALCLSPDQIYAELTTPKPYKLYAYPKMDRANARMIYRDDWRSYMAYTYLSLISGLGPLQGTMYGATALEIAEAVVTMGETDAVRVSADTSAHDGHVGTDHCVAFVALLCTDVFIPFASRAPGVSSEQLNDLALACSAMLYGTRHWTLVVPAPDAKGEIELTPDDADILVSGKAYTSFLGSEMTKAFSAKATTKVPQPRNIGVPLSAGDDQTSIVSRAIDAQYLMEAYKAISVDMSPAKTWIGYHLACFLMLFSIGDTLRRPAARVVAGPLAERDPEGSMVFGYGQLTGLSALIEEMAARSGPRYAESVAFWRKMMASLVAAWRLPGWLVDVPVELGGVGTGKWNGRERARLPRPPAAAGSNQRFASLALKPAELVAARVVMGSGLILTQTETAAVVKYQQDWLTLKPIDREHTNTLVSELKQSERANNWGPVPLQRKLPIRLARAGERAARLLANSLMAVPSIKTFREVADLIYVSVPLGADPDQMTVFQALTPLQTRASQMSALFLRCFPYCPLDYRTTVTRLPWRVFDYVMLTGVGVGVDLDDPVGTACREAIAMVLDRAARRWAVAAGSSTAEKVTLTDMQIWASSAASAMRRIVRTAAPHLCGA